MDRIIRITLGIFIIILVTFGGYCLYTGYVANAYRTSLSSTYTYTCALSTDGPLYNATFFIPVPTTRAGSSPMVSQFSAQAFSGIPDTWTTTLFGSGKTTMLKITVPAIVPPAGTTAANPYVVSLLGDYAVKGPVETADPVESGVMFRPVQYFTPAPCRTDTPAGASCFSYITPLYADYVAAPGTGVKFSSSLAGKNSWKIFEPASNEFRTEISHVMFGENHGWTTAQGYLEEGGGSYDVPSLNT